MALEDFERHLRTLLQRFRPLSLDEYVSGWERHSWPKRSFLLTIDDGYVSTLAQAAPLLASRSVPAVVFVAPGTLGETRDEDAGMAPQRVVSADELVELQGAGIDVGAHGYDHTPIVGVSPGELSHQVAGAREAIATITGREVRAFAYPHGLFDDAAVAAVRDAGYGVAFAVHDSDGRYAVPRLPITSRDSSTTFSFKLLPGYEALWRVTATRPRIRRLAARIARQRAAR